MSINRIYRVIIISFWIIVGYSILQFYNPLRVVSPFYKTNKLFYIFPQGWGFFTKDPQEDLVNIYVMNNNTINRFDFNNSSRSNSFGLSKDARYIMMESSYLYNEVVKSENWTKGYGVLSTKVANSLKTDTVKYNNYKILNNNTEYIFLRYQTIPFEWSEREQEKYNPYEAIKVYVK